MITVTISGNDLDEIRAAARALAIRLGDAQETNPQASELVAEYKSDMMEPAAEPAADEPELTTEFLRDYTISNYLSTHFDDAKARAAAFKELLELHGVEKLTLLPESKFKSWYDEVNRRIAS